MLGVPHLVVVRLIDTLLFDVAKNPFPFEGLSEPSGSSRQKAHARIFHHEEPDVSPGSPSTRARSRCSATRILNDKTGGDELYDWAEALA